MMKQFFPLLVLMVFTGCASIPDPVLAPQKTNGLSAQTLPPGTCGLFVWTAAGARQFILFSRADTGVAEVFLDNQESSFRIIAQNGQAANGQYPEQKLQNSKGRVLTLALSNPQEISGGTRFQRGSLTGHAEDGWQRVIPVIGLSACQSPA